jgi:hypothetical protein
MGAMAYRYSIHVEAPVEKVFDFFRDPGNWHSTEPEGIEFKDVRLTQEGIGTHYSWSAKFAGFSLEGFDVFTEFIPNQRITDRSSSSLEGTWTYLFEPDGSGTMLTVENRVRSFWRIPPLERLLEWAAAKTHEPRFARLKEALEGRHTGQDGTGY